MVTFLEWLITIVGVSSTFLAGRKHILSWPLGIVSQLVWVGVSIYTAQWAFLPASFFYVALDVVGWRRWARERSIDGTSSTSPGPPDLR